MSKNVGANALQFPKPRFGLFSVPPLSISMTFPDAQRSRPQAQPSSSETEVAAQEAQASGGAIADGASAQKAETQVSSADLDRAAVEAALRGDQRAFAELVGRYQSAVYNLAYRMLGDPTEAEDAAQEVFVRAWNQLHTFQLDRRFSTWLLSIASHYSIDLLRRRKPSAPLDDVALFVESDDPAPEEIAL